MNGEWRMENGEIRMPAQRALIDFKIKKSEATFPTFSILNSQFSIPSERLF
jgi:hypothetical protein